MKRLIVALAFLTLAASSGFAGWPHHEKRESQVPPRWALPGLASPAALTPPSYGRRPWAYALAQSNTPSAKMARFFQLGGGVGPTPGVSNEPGWYPGFYPGVPWSPNPIRYGW